MSNTKKQYSNQAQDILDMIRARQNQPKKDDEWYEKKPDPEILRVTGQEDPEAEMWEYYPGDTEAPLNANSWQEFKRKFVETYGDEKIQPTGMTHSEYMEYIKTSGWREGDEWKANIARNKSLQDAYKREWTRANPYTPGKRLKEILDSLDDD